jgi:hypothetical protein
MDPITFTVDSQAMLHAALWTAVLIVPPGLGLLAGRWLGRLMPIRRRA